MYYTLKAKPKSIQYVKGVGPSKAKAFEKEGILTDVDLLYYFPRAYISRSSLQPIKQVFLKVLESKTYPTSYNFPIEIKEEVTVIGKVVEKKIQALHNNRKLLIVWIMDFDGSRAKILFWQYVEFYYKNFNVGEYVIVRGIPEVDKYNKVIFSHPEFEILDTGEERNFNEGSILPVYPIPVVFRNSRINNKSLRKIIGNAFQSALPIIEDYLPQSFLQKYNIPPLKESILRIHFPIEIDSVPNFWFRIKFDEIFVFELVIRLLRNLNKSVQKGPVLIPNFKLLGSFQKQLSFELTNDQKKAIDEIFSDLASGKAMNRLLQGDVGSGKTIVSVFALLLCVENGYQALIMAPTEILAEQHYLTLLNLLRSLPVRVELIVGSQTEKLRKQILTNVVNGSTNIIVGTHALFESKIRYNRLGLVVIDEQHRFGVDQRARLRQLGIESLDNSTLPHILVISATPIPRTLAMTLYGDLDVSIIRQMPKGRKQIHTRVIGESELQDLYQFVRKEIKEGRQAYFVYPLVEKSDKSDFKAAIEHFEILQNQIFPDLRCGLLYGTMPSIEKEKTMSRFKSKQFDILVSTTVIEVGIDVPNATIMVIENAERFGLSQLHQLRGRVGRGEFQSYCFLVTNDKLKNRISKKSKFSIDDEVAISRLLAMEENTDGFKIAEIDLSLRGPGDIIGTMQSGLPPFKYINFVTDGEIIAMAREIADELLNEDSNLDSFPSLKKIVEEVSNSKRYFSVG